MRCFIVPSKLLCLSGVLALAVFSCKTENAQRGAETVRTDEFEVEYIEPAIGDFKEPADLKIDYKKALYFSRASEALVIMSQEWAENMTQADDEEKLRMAASYEKAQEELIRKFGLQGKEEFKWLQLKALHYSENKEVFARAGVWIGN